MGVSGGIGAMNERDNFALVPRRPGALEKAEPGAKRILSGMVADTLALVKKEPQSKTIFFAAMCGFVWNPKQFDEMIADNLLEFVPASKGKVELKCFTWTNELINATRRLRFDLFILLLNPHLYCWKSQNEAPVRANLDVGDMSNTSENNAYELIASLKREFKKPIIAVSNGYYSTTELEAAV